MIFSIKSLRKLFSAMLAIGLCSATAGCGNDDDGPATGNDNDQYEIVGIWTYVDTKFTPAVTVTMDCNKNGQIVYSYTQAGKNIKSGSARWTYRGQQVHQWDIYDMAKATSQMSDGTVIFVSTYSNSAIITGNKLLMDSKIFTRGSQAGSGTDDNTAIYSGQAFVGTWQGGNDWDEQWIELGADGSYIDYTVSNGQKGTQFTGTYTVSGNTLLEPSVSNLKMTWDSKHQGFKFKISGNKMTLTNSDTDNFDQPIVLTRK